MPRVKRGTKAKNRRKKYTKLAKGFTSRRKNCRKLAMQSVVHAQKYSYRDRRQKKRLFRTLWISRLNAALQEFDVKYSVFIKILKDKNILLNRKMLSNMAILDPKSFGDLVKSVRPMAQA